MKVQPIDFRRVYAERIDGRKIIYLDNNIWILLRDGGAAKACRDHCLEAVREGRAIFPASYAAVSELFGIPSPSLRASQAELMDALCMGVTSRSPEIIFRLEARHLYARLFESAESRILRNEAYTSLPDYLGTGELEFAADTPASVVEVVINAWNDIDLPGRSLRWLSQEIPSAAQTERHAEKLKEYVALMENLRARRLADPKERSPDRNTAILRERVALFRSSVIPACQDLLARDCGADAAEIRRRLSELGAGEIGGKRMTQRFRASLPSMEVAAQLHGMRAVDLQRRTRPQDFWDIEHASFAMVYADAFVSADGGLTALLEAKTMPPTASAKVLKTVDALERWLGAA